MAIVQFQFRVEGVLTDVDSAVLSDPTGTYGIKRNDTSATVVAVNTAMSHDGTGLYSYTFAEPSPGLSYTAYIKYVRNSATTYIPDTIVGAISQAAGYYAAQSDVENLFGTVNVATYSNLAGGTTTDVARVQAALTNGETEIDNFFRGGPYNVPLPINTTTMTWAATIAGEWLYRARGYRDDDPVGSKIKEALAQARCEMGQYKCEVRRFGDATRTARLPQMPQAV